MAKKPFIKIVPVKAISRSTFRNLMIAYIGMYYLLPLITLIPREISGYSLANWYLLVMLPVGLVMTGIIIGMNYGFYPMLFLGVAIGTVPTMLIFGFAPFWQFCIFYAAIVGAANLATELFRTTGKGDSSKK